MMGIEFSSPSKEFQTHFHITAFHFDPNHPDIKDYLDKMSYKETEETRILFERGKDIGYIKDISWDEVLEFNKDNNWDMLDALLDKICGLDNVWYATNIDIYRYKMAQKQLVVSADETIVYNPTDVEVCFRYGPSIIVPLETVTIAPGETIRLSKDF
jgi:hypothetical protein